MVQRSGDFTACKSESSEKQNEQRCGAKQKKCQRSSIYHINNSVPTRIGEISDEDAMLDSTLGRLQ